MHYTNYYTTKKKMKIKIKIRKIKTIFFFFFNEQKIGRNAT